MRGQSLISDQPWQIHSLRCNSLIGCCFYRWLGVASMSAAMLHTLETGALETGGAEFIVAYAKYLQDFIRDQ